MDDGTSILDTDPESVKRRISLSLAVAPFEWTATDGQTYLVNLLDTPAMPTSSVEVEAAFSVCDLAVFVVSAVDGVEVQTEILWRLAADRGIPRLFFVNKEDKDRADFTVCSPNSRPPSGRCDASSSSRSASSRRCTGIADVLTEQAYEYEPGGTHHTEPMPADVADEEHRLHDALVEEIVSGDDEQLERYLSGEVPSVADLERTLGPRSARLHRVPRPPRFRHHGSRARPSGPT